MLIADKQKHCHGCGWCDEIIWVGERRGDQTRPIMMVISVLGLPLLWAERILYPFNQDALKASRCPSSGSNPSRAAAHVSHKQEGVRSLVSCACVIRPFKQNKSERASEWVSGSPSISFAGNLDWTGVGLSVGGRKKTILCCGDWQFASAKELSTRAFISIEVQLR